MLDLFHEISDRLFNPRLPILQNTDGEPLWPHKLVFDLKAPPQAAFDALKHLALDEADEDLLADATRDSEDNSGSTSLSPSLMTLPPSRRSGSKIWLLAIGTGYAAPIRVPFGFVIP